MFRMRIVVANSQLINVISHGDYTQCLFDLQDTIKLAKDASNRALVALKAGIRVFVEKATYIWLQNALTTLSDVNSCFTSFGEVSTGYDTFVDEFNSLVASALENLPKVVDIEDHAGICVSIPRHAHLQSLKALITDFGSSKTQKLVKEAIGSFESSIAEGFKVNTLRRT